MAAQFQIKRVNALPEVREANTMYLVKAGALVEIHQTGTTGAVIFHTITEGDVNNLIAAALATALVDYSTTAQMNAAITTAVTNAIAGIDQTNNAIYAADIAARDALAPTKNVFCYVADATGDNTVAAGGAMYFFNQAGEPGSQWVKVTEYESMDVITPSEKAILSKFGVDGNGNLTYDGAVVGSVVQGAHEW